MPLVLLTILLLFAPPALHAADDPLAARLVAAAPEHETHGAFFDEVHLVYEMSGATDNEAMEVRLGMEGGEGRTLKQFGIGVGGRLGNRLFGGLYGGVRQLLAQRDDWLQPYLGASAYVGMHTVEVSVDHDGEDNDGDGFVDEQGETEDRLEDSVLLVSPEAGLLIAFGNGGGVTVGVRYDVNSKGRDEDDVCLLLGFVLTGL